ncbi:hypothetical protein [Microbacterium sp. E-13]|uniref:hypothetical protein n=1 Tax=Microbacterium sp. E-13 TaxID=3404048 RepID=UPI003CF2A9AE
MDDIRIAMVQRGSSSELTWSGVTCAPAREAGYRFISNAAAEVRAMKIDPRIAD